MVEKKDKTNWTALKTTLENLRKNCPIRRQAEPLKEFESSYHQARTQHEDNDCKVWLAEPQQG